MTDQRNIDGELVTFKNSQGLKARGTLLKLSQNFIVFEVYNPYSIVQLSEVLTELTITRADKQIYNGKSIVTNIVNTGIVLVVSATLSDSYWKTAVNVRSKDEIQKEIEYLVSNFESSQKIDPEFGMTVLAIRSLLSEVNNWLEKLGPAFEGIESEIDEKFILDKFSPIFERMTVFFRKLSTKVRDVPAEEMEIYKRFINGHLHPFIMSSPFPYRAYFKPLGFAGDYMMMYMIQVDSAKGASIYTKLINVFYAYIPLSRSVTNRTANLIRLIQDGVKKAEDRGDEFRSLSIGCGPALEVKKFIEANSPKTKCRFGLLDFNQETLDFAVSEARKVIKDSSKFEVSGELNSVHELLKRSVKDNFFQEKYDLVYCSGLFDYLSDRVCSKLTKMFFDMLKPGGKVLVTNMHVNDVDRHIVEIVLEWYLIYRDEANMANFVPGLGEQKLYTDATGINLCLEITKV